MAGYATRRLTIMNQDLCQIPGSTTEWDLAWYRVQLIQGLKS